MPIALWAQSLFKNRVEFETSLTLQEIELLVSKPELKVLQTSTPVEARTWVLLNERFFPRRPEVELRLWGFPMETCDLAFTARMSNVRHFSADYLTKASGVEHIAAMEKLESLGVGIFHLQSFEFLRQVTPRLKRLFLGQTRSKKPDLAPLGRFTELEEIYLEGQQKNIEILSQLAHLQEVTLRSISTAGLDYLKPLERLWSLDIKLGGITDLSAITGMQGIKYLELWQVRGLEDIGVISSLRGLQYLFLQALRNVEKLPDLRSLSHLRRIYLENLKGLEDISSLEFAPALEEFIHTSAGNMKLKDYVPLLRNPSLKRAGVWFGSEKRNKQFKALLRQYQVEPIREARPFEFV